ncbi:MAG: hypothetical protein IPK22_14625 [Verrucomicrobiaceae bacterium]|nr:hypothetical protein [Verrucomicrobiaceae bacterium]
MRMLLLIGLLSAQLLIAQESENLEKRLSGICVERTSFHEINLELFVEELRHLSASKNGQEAKPRINFVLIADSQETFSMPERDISLLELLQLACRSFKLKAVFDPHAVVIVPADHRFINPATNEPTKSDQEAISKRRIKPTIQFQDATIEEACEYLVPSVRAACDPSQDLPPLNLVLKSTPSASARHLSIYLHDIPIHETLRYFGELSGLKLQYQAEGAVLSPVGDDLGKTEIRDSGAAKLRADQILLPKVEFMDVTLADVVTFVQTKSAEIDPSKKGVRITVPTGLVEKAPCTLSLRRMSVSEVLRYAAGLMELKLIADDQGFIFAAK